MKSNSGYCTQSRDISQMVPVRGAGEFVTQAPGECYDSVAHRVRLHHISGAEVGTWETGEASCGACCC